MATIVDINGGIVDRTGYGPFGKPREDDWDDLFLPVLPVNHADITPRGFTDHEHLDDAQLIHMNGRAYDYNLGRFLSVDPFIQAPGNSQSFNPYSYAMNNPLARTDPSGYASETEIEEVDSEVEEVDSKVVSAFVTGRRTAQAVGKYSAGSDGSIGLKLFAGAGVSTGGNGAEKTSGSTEAAGAVGGGTVGDSDGSADLLGSPGEIAGVNTDTPIVGGVGDRSVNSVFDFLLGRANADEERDIARERAVANARGRVIGSLNSASEVKGWDSDPYGAFVKKRLFGGYKSSHVSLDYGTSTGLTWGGGAGFGLTDWVVVLPRDNLSLDDAADYIRVGADIGVENLYISTTNNSWLRSTTHTGRVNLYRRFSLKTNFRFTINPATCAVLEGAGQCPN